MSDEAIFEGYRRRLRAGLLTLRGSFGGRLIVRNCHAGAASSELQARGLAPAEQPQRRALARMNAIIAAVATELCVPLLDVFALDELAGGFVGGAKENFHVPPSAAARAAVAVLMGAVAGLEPGRGRRARRITAERPDRWLQYKQS